MKKWLGVVGAGAVGGCLAGGPTVPELPATGGSEGTGGGATSEASEASEASATGATSVTEGGTVDTETGVADSTGSSDSSSGEPPQEGCETDVDFCDTWFLRPDTQIWEARRMYDGSPHAPEGPALAAFDIDESNEGYVLTASTYHVLDLTAGDWVGSGLLVDLMPEVAAHGGLVAAISVHNEGQDETAIVQADDGQHWTYRYVSAGSTFELIDDGISLPGWEGPDSPAFGDMKDGFLDLGDAEGWYTGGVVGLCGVGLDLGYVAMITTSGVSLQDIGNCYDYYPPQPYESFTPFGYEGAPPHAAIGAVLYNDVGGLWVFRGT